MIHTQIIDNDKAFSKLEMEWNTLLSKSEQNHLYLTHGFLFTWWRHLSSSSSLYIILVKEDDDILAIAPFMLTQGKFLRFPVRKIEFIGSGWGYGDIIFFKKKKECLERIFTVLAELRNWDITYFSQTLNGPDMLPNNMIQIFPQQHFVHDSTRIRIPYIPLQGTWDEYLSERSSKFKRNTRVRSKKLNELGRINFLRITSIDESHFSHSKVMEWLHTIAECSWKAKAGTAISSNKQVFNFYSELAEKLNAAGSLDLCFLFVDEKPVAYCFGALYNRDYYEIDLAYDEQYSKVSPGNLLRNLLLKELFQEDLRNFDFVAYFDYKRELTSHFLDCYNHLIYRNKLYPLFLRYLRTKILPMLKRSFPSIKTKN